MEGRKEVMTILDKKLSLEELVLVEQYIVELEQMIATAANHGNYMWRQLTQLQDILENGPKDEY